MKKAMAIKLSTQLQRRPSSRNINFLVTVFIVTIANLQESLAQPGFLSIDCGASEPYVDGRNISWVPDTKYMSIGSIATVALAEPQVAGSRELSTLRYFSDTTRSRFCYVLPSTVGRTYLVRPRMYHGGYDTHPALNFDVYVRNSALTRFTFTSDIAYLYQEFIFVATTVNVELCLIRTSVTDNPFISSLEMRPIDSNMYSKVQDGSGLRFQSRANYGAQSSSIVSPTLLNLGSENVINSGLAKDKPPAAVMNTAVTTDVKATGSIDLSFSTVEFSRATFYMALYFADLQNLTSNESRVFDITINNKMWASSRDVFNATSKFLYVPVELSLINSTDSLESFNVTLVQSPGSTLGPIVNAAELYAVTAPPPPSTLASDVSIIESVKAAFKLTSYSGDPCLPIPYEWLECSDSSPPRVSTVKLSKFGLSGAIPLTMANLTNLTALWLDNNALTGEIPDLSTLTVLKLLHLENNRLTGPIPGWLTSLTSLHDLYLQNNQLSGNVPNGLLNNSALIVQITPGNVGVCFLNGTCISSTKSNNVGVIVGTAVGIVVVVIMAVGLTTYCLCFAKMWQSTSLGNEQVISQPNSSQAKYTLAQINAATNNYERLIGKGGFGLVYYGKLPGGQEVAVKVAAKGSSQGSHEFLNEVELLTRIHHKYFVSLVGYCQEDGNLILLYEYMPNGTLQEHLYGGRAGNISREKNLNWKTRLNIALNAAQGLEYLHVGCNPAIIHRDVKSNNILLTKDWGAKVADFGLSKSITSKETATHVSTMVKGTVGYLDPDYYNTNQLTDKSDVYSFGIVLLELMCGRPPFMPSVPEDQGRIDQWVRGHLQRGDLKSVVDQTLGDDFNVESMWKVAEIAMTSVEPKSVHRPRMSVVCQELRDAIEMENLSTPSTNSYLSHPFSSLSFEKTPNDVATSFGYSSVLSPR